MTNICNHYAQKLKTELAPMIRPSQTIPSYEKNTRAPLFCGFENAWMALNQRIVLSFIEKQIYFIVQEQNIAARFLLQENAKDLFNQTIVVFAKKLKNGGLVFDSFEIATPKMVLTWFRTVVQNAARDALKYKEPTSQKVRIDHICDNRKPYLFGFNHNRFSPEKIMEHQERQTLQDWLISLPLQIINTKETQLSARKRVVWKLYECPEQIQRAEIQLLRSKSLRDPDTIHRLLQQHMSRYLELLHSPERRGTERKNFILWLLFDNSYPSYETMQKECNQDWLARARDNQIRKLYGRTTTEIWTFILFRLLSSTLLESYERWFFNALQYALRQSYARLHPSRKGNSFNETNTFLYDWSTAHLSYTSIPSFSTLQNLFAFLYADMTNRNEWFLSSSEPSIDRITRQFKIAKRYLPEHPFHKQHFSGKVLRPV